MLKIMILEWCWWYLKNIEEYDPNKNHKILIVFDDMIVACWYQKEPFTKNLKTNHDNWW